MTVEMSELKGRTLGPGVDDVLVVRVTDEVDVKTAPNLQQALTRRLTG